MGKEHRSEALVDLLDMSPELLEWASNGNAQICPHCTSLVERSDGCRHMRCRCGGEFCFLCGDTYPCQGDCRYERDNNRAVLNVDVRVMIERRRKRRMAFLMGSRCEES